MAHNDPESGWRGRLAEMEEQLHALASELAEDLGEPVPEAPAPEPPAAPEPPPAPPAPEPPPPEPPPPEPPPRVAEPTRVSQPALDPNATLEAMCARLVASMREMLAGYELALTHVVSRGEAGPAVTVAAGPFASVGLLERFEDALRALPDVSNVAVRGYEGRDRAVLEVHLNG